jgi:hypothetical protein
MSRLTLLFCMVWATALYAQTTTQPDADVNAGAYQRMEAVRQREEALLTTQEAQCYQRFAVNACLADVQARRRAMLADLKRQETVLHDGERVQKAAEQVKRAQEKAQENRDRQAQEAREFAAKIAEEKLQAQQEKLQTHAAKSAASAAGAPRLLPQNAGPGEAEQAQNRAAYQGKQVEAEKKRQDIAKRQTDRTARPAPTLPVPP